ncbi:hypothetical protein CLV28_1449 [Sediminihabitans luteus]|uniref:Uncharacterized protein n=1 Tax=Sediminihabitans luteus TaxID=1138585 RepID=A0A2M9CQ52_9CELL|nr:hypothetical protein [Sediminihabitans luteus]PJJ73965.1 hypothetical protein CLV28_1449 [Sediminihabitans luteus]GII98122.1 hypothetical protein Slu03_05000 [Sediminihabitans luteus]
MSETALAEAWAEAWPRALAAWGPYTRLHAPVLHEAPQRQRSFAWFSTADVEVHIDLAEVVRLGVDDHPVEVLAHEVGHHLCSPGDLRQSARIAARVRVGLQEAAEVDGMVALVSNLWSDMLINDRLQRRAGLDMVGLWHALPRPREGLWQLVMRTDEILWGTGPGVLTAPDVDVPESEALLCARLVRSYADDPVGGAAGFALLVAPLLPALDRDEKAGTALRLGSGLVCRQHEPEGSVPRGVATETGLGAPAVHPADDARVVGVDATQAETPDDPASDDGDPDDGTFPTRSASDVDGNTLEPADLHAVLRALGLATTEAEAARTWYQEHAARHLVPFPDRPASTVTEPLLGAHETWDVGDELADVDWGASVARSPVVVPGMTTVRRTWDEQPGDETARQPVDLDLYLDSSGSMPDPVRRRAPIALAGAVLALSALRAGARVQATTWSGPDQIAGTDGFTRDANRVLDAIVAHFGGSTSFPLPLLARTHLGDAVTGAPPTRRGPCHVAVISDDGVTSMADDVTGGPWNRPVLVAPASTSVAARALAAADGGGSLVLQVYPGASVLSEIDWMLPGYDVYPVITDADLVRFSSSFARRLWGARPRGSL